MNDLPTVEDLVNKRTRPISFGELELIITRALFEFEVDKVDGKEVAEFIRQEHLRRDIFKINNNN